MFCTDLAWGPELCKTERIVDTHMAQRGKDNNYKIVKLISFLATVNILAFVSKYVNVKKTQTFPENPPKFVNNIIITHS